MLFPLCAYLVQYCVESRAPKVASSVQACQITGTEPRHPKQTLLPLLPLNIKESFVDLIAQTRTNKGVVLVKTPASGSHHAGRRALCPPVCPTAVPGRRESRPGCGHRTP